MCSVDVGWRVDFAGRCGLLGFERFAEGSVVGGAWRACQWGPGV